MIRPVSFRTLFKSIQVLFIATDTFGAFFDKESVQEGLAQIETVSSF